MAVAGFKIAVNHCLRPFVDVPIALYTDVPLAYIKCTPDDLGKHSINDKDEFSENILSVVDLWVKDFLGKIGQSNKAFRFDIKLKHHPQFSSEFQLISILCSTCTILNEWLHHPMEKNELLAWLIEKNQLKDADIISACIYGGIMSTVNLRPFRIYQPKGLYFYIETVSDINLFKPLPSSLVPIFVMALERSDFDTLHDLLNEIHPFGNMQESYLGALDMPDTTSRLHIYNVSTNAPSSINIKNPLSEMFGIDSNGCSVI